MTGKHPGHAYIRDNRQAKGFAGGTGTGPAGTLHLPLLFKKLGYTIGGFGKWGLGRSAARGEPLKQGFDRWFGYNCQGVAHNYYPTYLWDDNKPDRARQSGRSPRTRNCPPTPTRTIRASYARYTGTEYAPDLIAEQALEVRADQQGPAVLPVLSRRPCRTWPCRCRRIRSQKYAGKFPRRAVRRRPRLPAAPHAAGGLRGDGHAAWTATSASSLATWSRNSASTSDTIFVFTSDNGPLYDRLRRHRHRVLQQHGRAARPQGLALRRRLPRAVPGPLEGRIVAAGTHVRPRHRVRGLAADAAGAGRRRATSAARTSTASASRRRLLGKEQAPRPFLYRESPGYGGQQCVRVGDWKAVRQNLNPNPTAKQHAPRRDGTLRSSR